MSVAMHFSPIIKQTLQAFSNHVDVENASQSPKHRINVSEFDEETVGRFVQYLHGQSLMDASLSWSDAVNLYKIGLKFQVKSLTDLMTEKGKNLILKDNIYEAIILIDSHDINEWLDGCCSVLLANKDLMKTKEWEDLIETNPKTMARLLNYYIIKKEEEEEEILCDLDSSNLPLKCTFENGMCPGYTHDNNRKFKWKIWSGATPSMLTGPTTDHTLGTNKGKYIYIDSSDRLNKEFARFQTPTIKSEQDSKMCVTFYFHMRGHTMGELAVFTRKNGAEKLNFQITKKQAKDKWFSGRFPIQPGSNTFQIVFQGTTSYSWYGDIALDDIEISEKSSCSFWPPEAVPQSVLIPKPPRFGPENQSTCGKRKYNPNSRIVGGDVAKPGQWPWMALILKKEYYGTKYNAWCGGTLLGVDWVITAAHCVANIPQKTDIKIRLGKIKSSPGVAVSNDSDVEKVWVHPDYGVQKVYNNDVALIKLRKPARLNDQVNSICLMGNENEPKPGYKCVISGWGKLWSGDTAPYADRLNYGNVSMRSRYHCYRAYGSLITDNMLCAGNDVGVPDTCQGDSGGPLIFESNGKWHLVGITSWGHSGGCGQFKRFGVYTRMTAVEDWIKTVTKYPNAYPSLFYD
ncbi:mannan-binding lectin serine protease 2-like isoform X2 [Hydractinia symbiolongicarpus]|nr:mannan-binding lectin serine protease 2-like isoform X2 [Hydractinia symbiolongicarpus]